MLVRSNAQVRQACLKGTLTPFVARAGANPNQPLHLWGHTVPNGWPMCTGR